MGSRCSGILQKGWKLDYNSDFWLFLCTDLFDAYNDFTTSLARLVHKLICMNYFIILIYQTVFYFFFPHH
jgi:hypothetical protein